MLIRINTEISRQGCPWRHWEHFKERRTLSFLLNLIHHRVISCGFIKKAENLRLELGVFSFFDKTFLFLLHISFLSNPPSRQIPSAPFPLLWWRYNPFRPVLLILSVSLYGLRFHFWMLVQLHRQNSTQYISLLLSSQILNSL